MNSIKFLFFLLFSTQFNVRVILGTDEEGPLLKLERAKELLQIYRNDGSLTAHYLLYDEYRELSGIGRILFDEILDNEDEAIKIVEKFIAVKISLDLKLQQFHKIHSKMLKTPNVIEGKLREEQMKRDDQPKPFHRFVLAYKLFMSKLMSEGGEGSWLHLGSFVGQNKYGKYQYHFELLVINQVSTLQSEELDHLGIVAILNGHLANRRRQRVAHERGGKARGLAEGDIALEIEEELGNLGMGGNGMEVKVDESESDGIAVDQNQRERPSLNRVLIEGAGPIGLYAAFQAFLAGASVTIVNDRSEPYLRNRMVFFDAKYMVQFRLLLGTLCDQLFNDSKPVKLSEFQWKFSTVANLKNVEEALKKRLFQLAHYVEFQTKNPNQLRIEYGTKLIEVLFPTKENSQFRAKLGHSGLHYNMYQAEQNVDKLNKKLKAAFIWRFKKSGISSAEFEEFLAKQRPNKQKEIIDTRAEEIKEELAKQSGHPTTIKHKLKNGKSMEISPQKQAELEFEGKAPVWKPEEEVPFDVLICAGGANDQIRTKYISDSTQETIPLYYSTAVFKKKYAKDIFKPSTGDELYNTFVEEPLGKVYDNDLGMDEIMEKLELQKQIQKSLISDKLKKKYANLSQLVMRGLSVKKEFGREYKGIKGYDLYETDGNGNFVMGSGGTEMEYVGWLENKSSLHMVSRTPPAIEEFFRDLQDEKELLRDANKQKEYNEFRLKMERLWLVAVFEFAKSHFHHVLLDKSTTVKLDNELRPGDYKEIFEKDAQILEFDEHGLVNSSSWSLVIQSVKEAVKEFQTPTNEQTAIGLAVGDANTSGHFMTSAGMSTGRLAVEKAVQALRDYHQWKIAGKEELVQQLRANLNSIKGRVLDLAEKYVEPISIMDEEEGTMTNKRR